MNISVIGDLLKTVNGIIESFTSNSKEKKKLKTEVSYAIIQSIDKVIEAKKEVIITEAKGNFLQRSWRPIIMLAFAGVVLLGIFIDIPMLKDSSPFWDVLEMGLGGYVIGRSAEKVAQSIGKKLL